jgi:hypothetical protein
MRRNQVAARLACALLVASLVLGSPALAQDSPGLRAATFDVDVTPPIGSAMPYGEVIAHWDLGLRARGIVLLGAGEPIVLCAVDWVGIANAGHDAFRTALADPAKTSPERVAVHALHQHDAPSCDFTVEEIVKAHGLDAPSYDGTFAREVIARLAEAVKASLDAAQPLTHVGIGSAEVHKVASNRRILGPQGKTVMASRFTTCVDPELRSVPEGTIDPMVSVIALWNEEAPIAVLSHYACHPQSYYRTGVPNPDFPGVARFMRQLAVPDALHVHFTGAAGNVGAGKYNDGSHENRLILAERLADGMRRAWEDSKRHPLAADDVTWRVVPLAPPPAARLSADKLKATLNNHDADEDTKASAAYDLFWLQRSQSGKIDASCLAIGPARILHLPGELFVEYQLAAKALHPDLHVVMAAYCDKGPGYIGTAEAYAQGGYEVGPRASKVAPEVEGVLMAAIEKLLKP